MIKVAQQADRTHGTAEPTASAEDMLARQGLTGLRVLLVEDDPGLRSMTLLALERLGAIVTSHAEGELALEEIDAGMPFDLLFTDIDLGPGCNGFDLAMAARQRDRSVAVLLTSGCRVSIDDATRLGSDIAVVPKPYPLPELLDAIGRATAR